MNSTKILGLTDHVLTAISAADTTGWASFYLDAGLKPLPKAAGKKHPAVDWKPYETQVPTANEIQRWFGPGTDGVCLVLDGTGYVVLDCDGPPDLTNHLLAQAGVQLPHACPRVVTGRGQHWYLRTERPVGRHVGVLRGDGGQLDVLGAGCVVAPPSVHPETGDTYRWSPPFLRPDLVPPLPNRISELIADVGRPTQPRLAPVDGPIRQGERERTLVSMLGAARRRGAHEPELRALAEAANRRCQPPLASRDLDRLARSVARYEPDDLDVAALIASVSAQQTERTHRRTVTLLAASTITPRPVRWAWTDRIALGTLVLVAGREGIGKTILVYTLAADITRGRLPGVYEGQPRSVIVAATEDSWSHTIVPRLMAAGADLDRVFRVDVTTGDGVDTTLSLPRDLNALERVTSDVGAAAIILDPLLSRLDSTLDTHKDAEVRRALEPLVKLADKSEACVLGVIHVNKGASADPLTLVMGSRAFAAVSRAVLFVMVDPDDETQRLLGQPKNNLGRTDLRTLAFQINGVCVAETDEGPVWTGQLEWLGQTDRSITEAVGAAARTDDDRSATSDAADWLEDYLSSLGGRQDVAILQQEGRRAGHSRNALYRARKRLHLVSQSEGFPRHACWTLPSPVVPPLGESGTTGTTGTNGTTAPGQSSQSSSRPIRPSVPNPPARVGRLRGTITLNSARRQTWRHTWLTDEVRQVGPQRLYMKAPGRGTPAPLSRTTNKQEITTRVMPS